ncbi:MAG TPA: hypothetical protein VGM53_35895 [Streptosporangiaceae bacterium]|jgi:hypothetical protein
MTTQQHTSQLPARSLPQRSRPMPQVTGVTHRYLETGRLRAELAAAGWQVTSLVSLEGAAFLLADLAERLADDADRRVVLETARALESVPELLGVGPHLLATAA